MENTVKITKAQYFEAIKAIVAGEETEITVEQITEFCDTQIEQLAARAEKAKERAAAKKAESDAMTDAIAATLTDEAQLAEDILEQIIGEFEDATKAKVVARLTKLVASGRANKEQVAVEGAKGKRMAYTLCTE